MAIKALISGTLLFLSSVITTAAFAAADYKTDGFSFVSDGNVLDGIISRPVAGDAASILILVHSYGPTNVVAGDRHKDIRSRFAAKGISVVVWDKPGCGNSEGAFDINQPIESSAIEIVEAVAALKASGEPGSEQIGLIGFSRGGWIAPVAISKRPDISFWISVSGTDTFENWGYLLRSNMALEGYSPSDVNIVYNEWINGNLIFNEGGSYQQYVSATKNFRRNAFVQKITGQTYVEHTPGTPEYATAREEYVAAQLDHRSKGISYDDETGLPIVVRDFDKVLSAISGPVLAIFGDNDKHVNWRTTKALYERTLGARTPSNLTVKVFEGADHSLRMGKTGGFFEPHSREYWDIPYADGYYETMIEFVCANSFCAPSR
ncbi:MAG: alpha/beta hydrolase [Kordiimonadaceae bacterium]|nr:alpha/beta hydrolase [Kordiimonadaceae bacterium]MBO6569377.1 alpha/beta hydrolase [Kordiimonadaceae bacterium]MBO6964852.1 alpha/beta hydrolase [Kordiimonadaceae bacterium]